MREKAKAVAVHSGTKWGAIIAIAVTTAISHYEKKNESTEQVVHSNANAAIAAQVFASLESHKENQKDRNEKQDEALRAVQQNCAAATKFLSESIDRVIEGQDRIAAKKAKEAVLHAGRVVAIAKPKGRSIETREVKGETLKRALQNVGAYQRPTSASSP